jgi:futalosine hydrolase
MRVLVVAATDAEVEAIRNSSHAHRGVDFLVTGVGMVPTAARASRALALDRYDAALNVGLCGSFNPELPPAAVVHVISDRIAELGAEDGDEFIAFRDLNLPGEELFTSVRAPKSAALDRLARVTAITVNTVHGREGSIAAAVRRFAPDVESMEGAGFMCACLAGNVPCAQVRAVSNIIERRNRGAWKIPEALASLTIAVESILDDLL